MDKNILINIHRILVFIRYNIKNNKNIYLINTIIMCIREKKGNDVLVNALCSEIELVEQLELNVGELQEDRNNIRNFLLCMLIKAKEALQDKHYELAYDVIDMLHVLPELMLFYDRIQLKKYWKASIKTFSIKWKDNVALESKKYFY